MSKIGKNKGVKRKVRQWLCALLAIVLLLPLAACSEEPPVGSSVPLSPGLSVIEGEPVHDAGVAMKTDNYTVTPGMMAYFFYSYGGALIEEMNKQVPYDGTKTLHEQIYRDGLSWYDVLMNSTLQKVSEMLIYCEAARAAGVALTEAQQTAISNAIMGLRVEAASDRLELDAYLKRAYGPRMTEADLISVYELESLAATYSATVTKELEQGITQEQVEAAVTEYHLTDTTPSRNIAYLAVPYVGGKANETAIAAVMGAMQATPTAETLQGLAEQGSFGREENLTHDNSGVKAITDWLYAAGRSVGEFGRVEAGGATYILIYTGNGMSFAHVSARMTLYDNAYASWYNGWVERLHFGYNYDVIDSYDIEA